MDRFENLSTVLSSAADGRYPQAGEPNSRPRKTLPANAQQAIGVRAQARLTGSAWRSV